MLSEDHNGKFSKELMLPHQEEINLAKKKMIAILNNKCKDAPRAQITILH